MVLFTNEVHKQLIKISTQLDYDAKHLKLINVFLAFQNSTVSYIKKSLYEVKKIFILRQTKVTNFPFRL